MSGEGRLSPPRWPRRLYERLFPYSAADAGVPGLAQRVSTAIMDGPNGPEFGETVASVAPLEDDEIGGAVDG